MTQFSTSGIKRLLKKGKIRGFKIPRSSTNGSKTIPGVHRISPQKEWLELNLQYWCNDKAVILEREVKFADDRKWRFDWAIPALKIAIEYEGIYSDKSRHTTHTGFTGDIEKYNRASQLGWKVIRFTAKNYKTLVNELNACLHG